MISSTILYGIISRKCYQSDLLLFHGFHLNSALLSRWHVSHVGKVLVNVRPLESSVEALQIHRWHYNRLKDKWIVS